MKGITLPQGRQQEHGDDELANQHQLGDVQAFAQQFDTRRDQ
ncbi:MAG: hypothetical protein AAF499_01685 [Pseudomonadota bacterium]